MEVRRRHVDNSEIHSADSSSVISNTKSIPLIEPSHQPVQLWQWIAIFSSILLLVTIVPLGISSCGSVRPNSDDPNSSFQEPFARKHLQYVTGLGPRTGGSVSNEIHAKKYLLSELQKIVQLAQSNGMHAELDEQIARPSSFQAHVHVTSYTNIPNLILRLHDPRVSRSSKARSVLVNCHYDTAPQSPGASDAFVSCANALEVARVLAHGTSQLRNNIIFLFNSAEENILPASHAFVTQHPWAEEVATFINLEGAGAGGKLLVFQSGPGPAASKLVELYSSAARHPAASVAGEEIFSHGFIPSDTDFRIFRDYGKLPGLDFAYVGNGYAYHTCYDVQERISPACLQLAGENLLQLLTLMAQDPTVASLSKLVPSGDTRIINRTIYSPEGGAGGIHEPSKLPKADLSRYVYFDVLGFFVFKYPWWLGRYLHVGVLIGSTLWIFGFQRSIGGSYCGITLAILMQVALLVSGFLFTRGVGYVIHQYGCRMSWFTNRYNVFGVFLFPLVTYFFYFHTVFLRIPSSPILNSPPLKLLFSRSGWFVNSALNARLIENDFFKSAVLLVNGITAFFLYFNSPASYTSVLWCVFTISLRWLYFKLFGPKALHHVTRLLLILVPPLLIVHISSMYALFDVFIPILGRSGHFVEADIMIATLMSVAAVPVLLFCSGTVQLTSAGTSRALRQLLVNGCITYLILIHTTPLGFPYTVMPETGLHQVPPSQQRVAVFHANRHFHENANDPTLTTSDSGIFFFPLDSNGFRYYRHPPSSSPNPLLLKFRRFMSPGPTEPFYFPEFDEMKLFKFQRNLPYCGVPLLYPLINAFDTMYYLPSPQHKSPSASYSIINRRVGQSESGEKTVNITLSIDSQSPLTQIFIRTLPDHARLDSWSFVPEVAWPTPVSIPARSPEDADQPRTAHFYINHVDPSIATTSTGHLAQPLVFWLQFTLKESDKPTKACTHCFDIALVSQYMDEKVPNGVSVPLNKILKRLPQWALPIYWISSYDHWRVSLIEPHS